MIDNRTRRTEQENHRLGKPTVFLVAIGSTPDFTPSRKGALDDHFLFCFGLRPGSNLWEDRPAGLVPVFGIRPNILDGPTEVNLGIARSLRMIRTRVFWGRFSRPALTIIDLVVSSTRSRRLERLISVASLLAALSAGVSFGRQTGGVSGEDPQLWLQEAVRLHQRGNLTEAVKAYRRYLEQVDSIPEVWSNLGAAYVALGDLGAAVAAYEEALRRAPDNVEIRRNQGLAYYKMGDLSAARACFERVLAARPEDVRSALLLADVEFRRGEYGRVVSILERFRGQAESNPALAYLLGTSLIRAGRVEEGQLFVDLILREGDSGTVHLMLGSARMMGAEPRPRAHSLLGRVLLSLNRPVEAAEAFRAELAKNPHDFDANFYLGSLLHERGEDGEAQEYLEKASRLRPHGVEVRYQLASTYASSGRLEEARDILEGLVSEEPQFIEAHVVLAAVYHRLGLTEQARREQEIVVRLHAEERQRSQSERRVFGTSEQEVQAGDVP